jgi:hypothetical protein
MHTDEHRWEDDDIASGRHRDNASMPPTLRAFGERMLCTAGAGD